MHVSEWDWGVGAFLARDQDSTPPRRFYNRRAAVAHRTASLDRHSKGHAAGSAQLQ